MGRYATERAHRTSVLTRVFSKRHPIAHRSVVLSFHIAQKSSEVHFIIKLRQ